MSNKSLSLAIAGSLAIVSLTGISDAQADVLPSKVDTGISYNRTTTTEGTKTNFESTFKNDKGTELNTTGDYKLRGSSLSSKKENTLTSGSSFGAGVSYDKEKGLDKNISAGSHLGADAITAIIATVIGVLVPLGLFGTGIVTVDDIVNCISNFVKK